MAGKYGAIFGTELQMLGPAGQVHHEGEAKGSPPPHRPPESTLTSVLGLQAGLCKHMHRSVGLDRRRPGWFLVALASLQLPAPSERWMLAVSSFSSGLGDHLDGIVYGFCTCFMSHGPSRAV